MCSNGNDNDNEFGFFEFVITMCIVGIITCTIMEITIWKAERESHQQIKYVLWRSQFANGAIKTNQLNDIGCDRYQYYHSYYWECPDKKIIEVRGRKGKITYEDVKK